MWLENIEFVSAHEVSACPCKLVVVEWECTAQNTVKYDKHFNRIRCYFTTKKKDFLSWLTCLIYC